MADAVTTSSAGSSPTKSKVNDKDGTETFTITVQKDRGDEVLFQRTLAQLKRLGGDVVRTEVGNLADLQRMGAAAVNGKPVEEGVLRPPTTGQEPNVEEAAPAPLEDVIAPGPTALGADAAEAAFGERVAQGERPDKGSGK